ncbi:glycosyltransferase family 2 protein [Sulfurimonas sp. HSL-3221]|uniref:glycosyltransferase family 2 protein n=1 Tax=Sulfurimonadaceae TaxID=2771471 RepID=UPI001E5E061D|nr:glycosyltransferase family A protein [Sulfurimonas sp. HSL-3221]UFS62411.1 glycosyltransferase family 2 protein [Sulfurimonas sp. HSL-3221]
MITVVIPTRNRAYTLQKVAWSYYGQQGVNEIIFVDDCSEDDTGDVVKSLAQAYQHVTTKYLRHETRRGASAGRITGYENASNNYVLFGEDDAFLAADYTEKLMQKFDEHPGAGIVSGRIIYMLPGETAQEAGRRFGIGTAMKPYLDQHTFMFNHHARLEGDFAVPFTHALFLTTKALLESYGYDPFYARGNGFREETDFQINAFVHGTQIIVTNDTHCFHLHGSDVPSGGQRANRFRQFYWKVYYTSYMYDKYYELLRPRLALSHSKNSAKLLFAWAQFYILFLRPLGRRSRHLWQKVFG